MSPGTRPRAGDRGSLGGLLGSERTSDAGLSDVVRRYRRRRRNILGGMAALLLLAGGGTMGAVVLAQGPPRSGGEIEAQARFPPLGHLAWMSAPAAVATDAIPPSSYASTGFSGSTLRAEMDDLTRLFVRRSSGATLRAFRARAEKPSLLLVAAPGEALDAAPRPRSCRLSGFVVVEASGRHLAGSVALPLQTAARRARGLAIGLWILGNPHGSAGVVLIVDTGRSGERVSLRVGGREASMRTKKAVAVLSLPLADGMSRKMRLSIGLSTVILDPPVAGGVLAESPPCPPADRSR